MRAVLATVLVVALIQPAFAAVQCAKRRGGALIDFVIEGRPVEHMRVWSRNEAFTATAERLLASGDHMVPLFRLRHGRGCNRRWTWHAHAKRLEWGDIAIELCDGAPSHIEKDPAYWFQKVHVFCPWAARVERVRRQP